MSKRRVVIGETKVCSEEYGVTTLSTKGGKFHAHRKSPCEECPWRKDVPTEVFPADAFRASADTSYDAAVKTFACHVSGAEKPATCAGFLLRHGENNLSIRLSFTGEKIDLSRIHDGGFPIYDSYRDMAIANGVPEDDPCLNNVRANDDVWDHVNRSWKANIDDE